MKYILYCRKSTDTEDKQVLSLESQQKELTDLAKNQGIEIVAILTEKRSAKAPGRPVFNEMLAMISAGKADAILCWKIDRLTRNPVDGGQIQWLLQTDKIKCIRTFEKSYFPSDNVLLMSIEQAMANQYIRDLSTNVKRGNRAKMEHGGWPSRAPFGYVNDRGTKTIKIDKKISPYIVRAFELYATGGYSVKQISDILYQEGLRTASGGKVCKNQIHRNLSHKFYIGFMEREGKIYEGKHTPLISKELFDKVQDVLNGKLHAKVKKHFYSARGFLTCASCSCALTCDTKKGFKYYYCTNGKGNCEEHKKYMRSEYIDGLISQKFLDLKIDEEMIAISGEAYKVKYNERADRTRLPLENLSNELNLLLERELTLTDGYSSKLIREEVYKLKLQEIENKRVEIKKQIKDLQAKTGPTVATFEQVKNVFLDGNKASARYLVVDDQEKRKMLEKLLSNASIKNGNMAQYQFKSPYSALAKAPKNNDIELFDTYPF